MSKKNTNNIEEENKVKTGKNFLYYPDFEDKDFYEKIYIKKNSIKIRYLSIREQLKKYAMHDFFNWHLNKNSCEIILVLILHIMAS